MKCIKSFEFLKMFKEKASIINMKFFNIFEYVNGNPFKKVLQFLRKLRKLAP